MCEHFDYPSNLFHLLAHLLGPRSALVQLASPEPSLYLPFLSRLYLVLRYGALPLKNLQFQIAKL